MNTQDAILQGLLNNTTVGQTGITKHMLFVMGSSIGTFYKRRTRSRTCNIAISL